jgi:hypothetical protein
VPSAPDLRNSFSLLRFFISGLLLALRFLRHLIFLRASVQRRSVLLDLRVHSPAQDLSCSRQERSQGFSDSHIRFSVLPVSAPNNSPA